MSTHLQGIIGGRIELANSDKGHSSIRATVVHTIASYINALATEAQTLLSTYPIQSLSSDSLHFAKEIVDAGIKIWAEHDEAEGPLATCEKLLLRTIHESAGGLSSTDGLPLYSDKFWAEDTESFQLDPLALWLPDDPVFAGEAEDADNIDWKPTFGGCLTRAAQAYSDSRHRTTGHGKTSQASIGVINVDIRMHQVITSALNDGLIQTTEEALSVIDLPARIKALSPTKLLVLLSSEYSDVKQATRTCFSSSCMTSVRDQLGRDIVADDLSLAGVMQHIRRKKRSGPPEDCFTPELLLSVTHSW